MAAISRNVLYLYLSQTLVVPLLSIITDIRIDTSCTGEMAFSRNTVYGRLAVFGMLCFQSKILPFQYDGGIQLLSYLALGLMNILKLTYRSTYHRNVVRNAPPRS